MKQHTRWVIPGEKIGIEEEHFPGSGVYLRDGVLYSSKQGTIKFKDYNAFVSRRPSRRFFPTRNSHLILKIIQTQRDRVVLSLVGWIITKPFSYEIQELVASEQKSLNRFLLKIVLIVNTPQSETYLPGDWIVVPMLPAFRSDESLLTLKEGPNDGILRGRCASCQTILRRIGKRLMNCPHCHLEREVKISPFYDMFAKLYRLKNE